MGDLIKFACVVVAVSVAGCRGESRPSTAAMYDVEAFCRRECTTMHMRLAGVNLPMGNADPVCRCRP